VRQTRRINRWVRVLAAITLTLSGGCGTHHASSGACDGTRRLVRGGCPVLWGAVTQPNTEAALRLAERRVGREFELTYRFHDLDDVIPTPDERAAAAAGRVLHIDIDARLYQAPHRPVTWNDVAAGQFDSSLTRQARGLASLRTPVFVTFDHESDQVRRSALGQPIDFVAAWRHIHELFRRAGADELIWVWVVTGYPPRIPAAAQMWPGNAYVDWISWEAYNTSGCQAGAPDPARYEPFASSVSPFFTWLRRHGIAEGIDAGKPIMISEAASARYSDPSLTAAWYRQIPAVLHQHPAIRAITLWDRPGAANCQYRFDDVPVIARAVGAAMANTERTKPPEDDRSHS
jgi:hypothetical protein